MNDEVFLKTIRQHIPEATIRYCYELWLTYEFKFIVKKKRATKLGDYSYSSLTGKHTITVNGDLNKYAFLITYLHEVAHLTTGINHGYQVKPHGEEWKNRFKELVYPVLREDIFPPDVIVPLHDYISNPKASSCSDADLLRALGEHDEHKHAFLSDIKIGESFRFNKKYYVKESTVRTRAVCKDLTSNKKYYIPLAAQVDVVQPLLF